MRNKINTIFFDVALADLQDIAKDFPDIMERIDKVEASHKDLVEQIRSLEDEAESLEDALDEANEAIEYLKEELEYATQE